MIRKLWPALIWAVLILILTGMPGKYVPQLTTFWDWLGPDKIVHVGIFAVLSFLILHGLLQQYLTSDHRYLFIVGAVGITLAYGLLTEVLQAHVFVGRYGNVYDFYADSIGAFCGWLVFSLIYRKKIKTFSNTNQD